jgi:mannitol-1-phosphate/altronate dehydrogenase
MKQTNDHAQSHDTTGAVGDNITEGFVPTRANIGNLPNGVRAPKFDPASVTPGIVHIGPGNFALAHLLSYVQDVLAIDPTWGVVVVSTQTSGMVTALRKQDLTYVLVDRQNDNRTATLMCPITEALFGPDDPQSVVDYIADARIRLVTMTLSNKGYCLAAGGGLDLTNLDVLHDKTLPEKPKTIYGYIAKGLIERKKQGLPLTIMSLDNVEKNSASLKVAMLQFLTQVDAELAVWTESNVDFLVTLVDRITPKVTDEFRHETREALGFDPSVVIGTESFRELVVEKGQFAMPPWDQVGVKYVAASASGSHWMRKFFCLNAGHQVAGIAGQRNGVTYVYEAMAHGAIARLLEQFHAELLGSIISGDQEYLAGYCAKIRDRFADVSMKDTVDRVVARTTSKVSERLLSSVELALAGGGEVLKAPTFIAAIWLHNLGGENEFGERIELDDADAPKLQDVHRDVIAWVHAHDEDGFDCTDCGDDVKAFLVRISEAIRDPRFARLAQVDAFVQLLGWSLVAIHQQGIEKAIDSLLAR